MAEYLEDLRSTVRDPDANVVLYERDEHAYAGIFGLNRVPPRRLGPQAGRAIYVVYSADYGWIVTGYQVDRLDDLDIPGSGLWLS